MARLIAIQASTRLEEIRSIEEITGELIRVMVGEVDRAGVFIVPQQYSTYEISGAEFEELMSSNPEWAPGKPENTYRNTDLWVFIDRTRASNQTSEG